MATCYCVEKNVLEELVSKNVVSKNTAAPPPWLLYIIKTQSGKLYTGITTNLQRRWRQHAGELRGGAKFFRSDPAACVVYREPHRDRAEASRREWHIKQLTRQQKLQLIGQGASCADS
jgi:putative endonuclease